MIDSQRRTRSEIDERCDEPFDDRAREVARWVAMRLDFERWLDSARSARAWNVMREGLSSIDRPVTRSR